jgi:cell division septum initiation protein DivIVA
MRRRGPAAAAAARPETADTLIARAHALAKEAAEWDKYVHGQRHEGISVMTDIADHDVSAAPDVPSQPAASSYADIGERVAGVLAAAETAANQIRKDARASAEEMLSIAREEAEALRRDATVYDADTRAAVDSYASNRRREVDEQVQKQLVDSEAQARATRQAAEAMARQIEEDARRRAHALHDESRAVEERLKKAAQGLRRMTAEIEELLGATAGDGDSLTDALRPYTQRPEIPVSAAPSDER